MEPVVSNLTRRRQLLALRESAVCKAIHGSKYTPGKKAGYRYVAEDCRVRSPRRPRVHPRVYPRVDASKTRKNSDILNEVGSRTSSSSSIKVLTPAGFKQLMEFPFQQLDVDGFQAMKVNLASSEFVLSSLPGMLRGRTGAISHQQRIDRATTLLHTYIGGELEAIMNPTEKKRAVKALAKLANDAGR